MNTRKLTAETDAETLLNNDDGTLNPFDPRNFKVPAHILEQPGIGQLEQPTAEQPGQPTTDQSTVKQPGHATPTKGSRPKTRIRSVTLTDEPFTIWPDALFKKLWHLCQKSGNLTPLGVVHVLLRLWFTGFKRNPVRLTTCALRKFGISRLRKYRALTLLEEVGLSLLSAPAVRIHWSR